MSDTEYGYNEVPIPRSIRFGLLLSFDIPAIVCAIYLLYQIFFKQNLREALHNHMIIVLLVISLSSQVIDIGFYMIYSRIGSVWLATPFFCKLWQFINIGLFNMIGMLLAYSSFERHILIFHSSLVSTRRKRLLFHYIPFSLTVIYGLTFYSYWILFPPCENFYDYTQPWCGYSCVLTIYPAVVFDAIFNCTFAIILMVFFNVTLIIRHIQQKRRIHQQIQWRKHRKMILQLLSVSLLLLIFYLPLVMLIMIQTLHEPTELGSIIQLYLFFFSYLVILLMPFVCFPSISNSWKKCITCPTRIQFHRTRTAVGIDIRDT